MTKTSWLAADGLAKPILQQASPPNYPDSKSSDKLNQNALTFFTHPATPPTIQAAQLPNDAASIAVICSCSRHRILPEYSKKISYNTQRCEQAYLFSGCRIKSYQKDAFRAASAELELLRRLPWDNIRHHEGKPAQGTSRSCFACCLRRHKITMKGEVRAPLLLVVVVVPNCIVCLGEVCLTCGTAGK